MTLSPQEKVDLSRYRLEKAKRLLKDARSLFDAGSYESSVNRSYYAALTVSKALLILRGVDAESYESTKMMLTREFIRTGHLPKEFGEIFRSLQARRVDSDYGDYVEIGKEEALDSFKRAGEFVQKIEVLLVAMTKDIPSRSLAHREPICDVVRPGCHGPQRDTGTVFASFFPHGLSVTARLFPRA